MLIVKNLQKKYFMGDVEVSVLNGIGLEIKSGEYILVTGRSGAGKSTLLYLLSLLDKPSAGEIIINDSDVSGYSESYRSAYRLMHFGYVFQDYALLPELTAWENVAVPLIMRGLEMDEVKSKAKKALVSVGLKGKEENLPNQLSGGQQQRVSIARAIAFEPKIIFADEPTANLDSKTAEMIMEVFQEINRNGQTIIMVTHEIKKAKGANRIIEISDGKIKK